MESQRIFSLDVYTRPPRTRVKLLGYLNKTQNQNSHSTTKMLLLAVILSVSSVFFITINLQIWIYSPESTAISTVTTSLNYTELFSHHPCPQLSSLSSEQTSCGHLHFNEDSAFCGKQLVKLPHLFPCVLIRYFFNPLTQLKYKNKQKTHHTSIHIMFQK